MSNYTDAVLKAITKNCRTEIRKEFRDQLAEVPKLKKEISRLKREVNKLVTENRKLYSAQKKIVDAEKFIATEYATLQKNLESLKQKRLASFINLSGNYTGYDSYRRRCSRQAAIREICKRVGATRAPKNPARKAARKKPRRR